MKKPEWKDDLKIGDKVEVKKGIQCPDYKDLDISGWTGEIFEIGEDDQDNILIGIRWDSKTILIMPDNFIEQGDENGLDNDLMYLFYEDVSKLNLA